MSALQQPIAAANHSVEKHKRTRVVTARFFPTETKRKNVEEICVTLRQCIEGLVGFPVIRFLQLETQVGTHDFGMMETTILSGR